MANTTPDVKLLFGASEESFGQINDDLKEVLKKIDEKPLGVKIGLNKNVKTAWAKDINDILSAVNKNKNNDFTVKISHIKISNSAITEFKNQLSAIIDTLSIDKGVSITLSNTGIGDVDSGLRNIADAAQDATKNVGRLQDKLKSAANKSTISDADKIAKKLQNEELSRIKSKARSAAYSSSFDKLDQDIYGEDIQNIRKQYEELFTVIEKVRQSETPNQAAIDHIRQKASAIKEASDALRQIAVGSGGSPEDLFKSQVDKVERAISVYEKYLTQWSAAKHGRGSSGYADLNEGVEELKKLLTQLVNTGEALKNFGDDYNTAIEKIKDGIDVIDKAGKKKKSFSDRVKEVSERLMAWVSASEIIMKLVNAIRQMVAVVIEIDTAMTELRKVTNETEATYLSFLDNATHRAKSLGATISDVVRASADFARLGYTLKEAEQIADAAIIYKNVGDGIEDINTASESIISTMQAFGISASDAMLIVDKFNKVGNEFAISSKGIGDALVRSAAAMHSAGNTIDETIALVAAANTVVQNPDSVGTTMKTISMYLRAAKTEAEAAGESTDGMVDSVSELRKEILKLTGNKVDIMTDDESFKSTYEILRELAGVWDKLADVSKANILEMIGGKRNANVVAALLENFKTAEDVMASAGDAAGSAMAENAKYLDSIQGHIAEFKAEFQELSTILVESDTIKLVVDIGTALLNVLDVVAKLIDLAGGLPVIVVEAVAAISTFNLKGIRSKIEDFIKLIRSIPTIASISINAFNSSAGGMKARLDAVTAATKAAGMEIHGLSLAIGAATAAISLFIIAYNAIKQAREERRQETFERAQANAQELDSVKALIEEYKELGDSANFDSEARDKAKQIQEEITNLVGDQAANLDLVNGKLEEQVANLKSIENEIAAGGKADAYNRYVDAYKQFNKGANARESGSVLGVVENSHSINTLLESSGFSDKRFLNNHGLVDISLALSGKNAKEALEMYKSLGEYLDKTFTTKKQIGMSDRELSMLSDVSSEIQSKIAFYEGVITELEEAERNSAIAEVASMLTKQDINTQEDFDAFIDSIKANEDHADGYKNALIEVAKEGFPQFSGAAQGAADSIWHFSSALTGSEIIDKSSVISEEMSKLSTAFKDFSEDGKLGLDGIGKLTGTFGSLPSFEKVATVLSSTSTSASEAKAALNLLAQEYMTVGAGSKVVGSILDGVSEETAELTEAMLEQIGVTNASALVNEKLEEQAVETALAEKGITDVFNDQANSLEVAGMSADEVTAALMRLRQETARAKIASLDFASATNESVSKLLQEAQAAGLNTKSLGIYATIKENMDKGASALALGYTEESLQRLYENIKAEAAEIANIKIEVPPLTGGSSTSKYISDIEEFREALERLEQIRLNKADIELELSHTDDLAEQIRLERDLSNVYEHEILVLKELVNLRSASIKDKIKTLEGRGFNIEYDETRHRLLVTNLEHLNELTKGGTKATNEYRKETEELIKKIEEMNSENQESSKTWKELEYSIKESKNKIVESLKGIVAETSEAIDSIQGVFDTLKEAADEFAANDGFISVDVFQSIVDLGAEYMSMLRDENGQLVINKERINDIIAAKTEQLALDNAMTYVERLRMAMQEGSIEDLDRLLYATIETTNATWGLVYANLAMLKLDGEQHQAALHNINAIRAMAENAISGIGKVAGKARDELEDMKSGVDDILDYVMDMIEDGIERQIDALEDEKDAYAELIDLKKKSMDETKKETDYQEKVADTIKKIAKLQAKIDSLSLDNSRDAAVQRAKLEEEMAELQKELADTQADHAQEAQKESLDKMQEAYEKEKDEEIKVLEESISSQQKLYDKAIEYIESHWDTLYQELLGWNTEYGSALNQDITNAWDNCLAAAQRYGSYVSALKNIDADIESANGGVDNITVGNTNYDSSYGSEDAVSAIITQMYRNMKEHGGSGSSTSPDRKRYLKEWSMSLGNSLHQYGVMAYRDENGTWWTDPSKTELLFEKYKDYIHTYHTGGIAGDKASLKQNEVLAKLEEKEMIIDQDKQKSLFRMMDFVTVLSEKFSNKFGSMFGNYGMTMLNRNINLERSVPEGITNNRSEAIHFGDVYVYGGSEQTVEEHRKVNREFTNEILRYLNVKR